MNSNSAFSSDEWEELNRYKNLKNAELSDIPDDSLERAVMVWMLNRGKDGDCLFDLACQLPVPCQNVFYCKIVVGEIDNGGLHQLFHNDGARWAEMSIAGFLALGSSTLSEVMAKALELYSEYDMAKAVALIHQRGRDGDLKTIQPYKHGSDCASAIKCFFDFHRDGIFSELDEAFYQERDSIDYITYIRSNADCFGD